MASVPKLKNAITDMDRKYKTLFIDVNNSNECITYNKECVLKLIQDVINDIKNIDLICQERNRY